MLRKGDVVFWCISGHSDRDYWSWGLAILESRYPDGQWRAEYLDINIMGCFKREWIIERIGRL